MYFFRAWWHFELMCYFGGLPYVKHAYDAEKIPELPRLSFQECADSCAEDFEKAASLLPMDWDETLTGQYDPGKNDLRINRFMALCYLGKCYLWAGSPLMKEMKNGSSAQLLGASSNGKTYDYDIAYCQKAAEVFGKVLNMVSRRQTRYKLAEFKYTNIYDHERDLETTETCYSDIFYTVNQARRRPCPGHGLLAYRP